MIGFFKHLRQRWNDWCGDHEMEVAIRQHLTQNGYFGGSAKLTGVRLVAVQRPGWLQVYRFDVTARVRPSEASVDGGSRGSLSNDEAAEIDETARYENLYGLIREDIRKNLSTTRVFRSEEERRSLFSRWSEDLICLRGSQGLLE